jgi:EAL domain-containing protein (putative c-di-GMP-specific phosphodiesterase class I)
MAGSPQATAIVRTTIDLGRRLGLRVVAVGVETAEQAAALADLGCPAAQGHYLYPPLDPEEVPLVAAGGGVGET